MARHERTLKAAAAQPLSEGELLDRLQADPHGPEQRQLAIACYLAAENGWQEAGKAAGGAFVAGPAELTERKSD